MLATAKAFINKDKLTSPEEIEAFLKQFQMDEQIMKELEKKFREEGKGALKDLKLNAEDIAKFERKFKSLERKAFIEKYKLDDSDMKLLRETIKNFNEYKIPLRDTSCSVVAIMSHGRNGKVYGETFYLFIELVLGVIDLTLTLPKKKIDDLTMCQV